MKIRGPFLLSMSLLFFFWALDNTYILYYSCLMTVTQTIEIFESSRRLTIEVPEEIPAGKVIIAFTPIPKNKISTSVDKTEKYNVRDLELINLNAEQLNSEALDVLSFQRMYLEDILDI